VRVLAEERDEGHEAELAVHEVPHRFILGRVEDLLATTCADEVSGVVAEQTLAGVQGVAGVPRVRYARRVGFGSLESRRHGIGCGGDVGKGRVSGWETRKRANH
jgi:hypothetical protein